MACLAFAELNVAGGTSKVIGKFTAFETRLVYDKKDLMKLTGKAKIKTAGINTGDCVRDKKSRYALC